MSQDVATQTWGIKQNDRAACGCPGRSSFRLNHVVIRPALRRDNYASIAARNFFIAFFSSWRTRSADTP